MRAGIFLTLAALPGCTSTTKDAVKDADKKPGPDIELVKPQKSDKTDVTKDPPPNPFRDVGEEHVKNVRFDSLYRKERELDRQRKDVDLLAGYRDSLGNEQRAEFDQKVWNKKLQSFNAEIANYNSRIREYGFDKGSGPLPILDEWNALKK